MIKKLKSEAFIITAATNMHPGSGDATFGVVDNLVQRDVVTELPTINSSSLKGALREFFENQKAAKDLITFVFGSEAKSTKDDKKSGDYSFLNADLLIFPVRSNTIPFFRATCPVLLTNFLDKWKLLCGSEITGNAVYIAIEKLSLIKVEKEKPVIFNNLPNTILEDLDAIVCDDMDKASYELLTRNLGKNLALYSDADFYSVAGKECIPVIARNYLVNGQSENLWHEEIVPRETRFAAIISYPYEIENTSIDLIDIHKTFESLLLNSPIQIGANASIGYGICSFTKLK